MINNHISELLADRVVLKKDVSTYFVCNMKERISYGIIEFKLLDKPIVPIYCSTINKHTCVEMLEAVPDTFFLILDEHHLELLGALNRLFYLYGQHDYKQPIVMRIQTDVCRVHEKRQFATIAQLLAEKSFLNGNFTRAGSYLSDVNNNYITEDDYADKEGKFALNLLLLKDRRAEYTQSLILNFYVFHELAHIKFYHDKGAYDKYGNYLVEIMERFKDSYLFSTRFSSELPIEDVLCDTYALDLIFDFIYNNLCDYQVEFMVDSYITAVTNMTIMDSIIEHTKNLEEWYVICWYRIILALNTVIEMKFVKAPELLKSIQKSMEYGHMKYHNIKQQIQKTNDILINRHGTVTEKFKPFSKEWKAEKDVVLSFLADIR